MLRPLTTSRIGSGLSIAPGEEVLRPFYSSSSFHSLCNVKVGQIQHLQASVRDRLSLQATKSSTRLLRQLSNFQRANIIVCGARVSSVLWWE